MRFIHRRGILIVASIMVILFVAFSTSAVILNMGVAQRCNALLNSRMSLAGSAMKRPNIFLTSFFRTKHHHLARSLCGPLGYHPSTTVGLDQWGDEEHVINIHAAQVLFRQGSQVFDQHTRATLNTRKILKAYEKHVKVIVMIRNVLDTTYACIRSLNAGGCLPGVPSPSNWGTIDSAHKLVWTLHNVVPWLLSFYDSWITCNEPLLLLRSEDYAEDPEDLLKEVLDFVGYPTVPEDILRESVDHQYGPNVGNKGEGGNFEPWFVADVQEQMESFGPKVGRLMERQLLS